MEVVAEQDMPIAFRKSEPDVIVDLSGEWLQRLIEEAREKYTNEKQRMKSPFGPSAGTRKAPSK